MAFQPMPLTATAETLKPTQILTTYGYIRITAILDDQSRIRGSL